MGFPNLFVCLVFSKRRTFRIKLFKHVVLFQIIYILSLGRKKKYLYDVSYRMNAKFIKM